LGGEFALSSRAEGDEEVQRAHLARAATGGEFGSFRDQALSGARGLVASARESLGDGVVGGAGFAEHLLGEGGVSGEGDQEVPGTERPTTAPRDVTRSAHDRL
jgi:hypothetical protein